MFPSYNIGARRVCYNLMRAARKPNEETALFWSAPVGRSQTCAHAARMSLA